MTYFSSYYYTSNDCYLEIRFVSTSLLQIATGIEKLNKFIYVQIENKNLNNYVRYK